MHNRVRSKSAMIRQSDANPEDNLSELDLKIYRMLPTVNYALLDEDVNDSCDPNFSGNGNHERVDHEETNYDNVGDETNHENFGYEEEAADFVETDDGHVEYEEMDREYAGYGESEDAHASYADLQRDNDYHLEIASAKVDSNRIFVAQNEEELDRYINDSVIVEDASDDSTDAIICLDDDQYNCSTENERAESINRIVTSEPKSSKKEQQTPQTAVKSVKDANVRHIRYDGCSIMAQF